MSKTKRLLAVMLTLAMVVSMASTAAFAAFTDVPEGHWAGEAIDTLVAMGILSGMGDGTFAPDAQTTRAQFLRMINNSLSFTAKSETVFEDVASGAWYADDIAIADAAGFLSLAGDHGGLADPEGVIDRQTVAAIAARAVEIKGYPVAPADGTELSDISEAEEWAQDAIASLVDIGIIKGFEDATFRPTEALTRAQSAVIITRLLDLIPTGSASLAEVKAGEWALTIDKPLTHGNTIRIGMTYYTFGRDFAGATPAEQAKNLSSVLSGEPLVADDDALDSFEIAYTDGENKITLTSAEEEYPPTFIFTSFRPANWWVDAPSSSRPYRRPDRIRPLDSWTRLARDGTFKLVETSEPWFDVYKIPGDTYVFFEPGQDQEVMSFLIVGTEKAILLDTGMGIGNLRNAVEDVLALPENSHIKIGENFIMVNTHTHTDHRGDSWRFPDVEEIYVWYGDDNPETDGDAGDTMTRDAFKFFDGPGGGAITTGDLMRDLPAEFVAELAAISASAENPLVRPGVKAEQIKRIDETHVFNLGGRSLQVVHTPGHSMDSITLVDAANKVIYTGDFFYPGPNYAYQRSSASLLAYYESAVKLWNIIEPMGIEWVYGAHNETTKGGEIIRELRDASKAILDLEVSGEAWNPEGTGGNISAESGGNVEYRFESEFSPTGNIRIQVNSDYDVRNPVTPPTNP